jgi:hypothetical protein
MLRIKYTMAVAALLLLQASSGFAFAAESKDQIIQPTNTELAVAAAKSDKIIQAATVPVPPKQVAVSDISVQQLPAQSSAASNAAPMEYPALALLAMAIISMAVLARRDSLRIDR